MVLPRSADLDAVERLLEAHTLSHGLTAWEGLAVEPPLPPDEDVYGLRAWKTVIAGLPWATSAVVRMSRSSEGGSGRPTGSRLRAT